jgi:uncharacterized Ntn-hydrolase superfamily protein
LSLASGCGTIDPGGHPMKRWTAILVAATLVNLPSGVRATWSIAAVDSQTSQVGVAGASCILGSEVIAELVPGRGAVVAQAFSNLEARSRLAAMLRDGSSPSSALDAVAQSGADSLVGIPTVRLRQYGVAALGFEEVPAHFTGSWTLDWAGARMGRGVTVQGNTLWGPEVVERAYAAFAAAKDRCLAERLLVALEAGARAGGDKRCSKDLSALSAFLVVARNDDAPSDPSLRLVRNRPGEPPFSIWSEIRRIVIRPEPGTRDENPVFLLRREYEASRASPGVHRLCETQPGTTHLVP